MKDVPMIAAMKRPGPMPALRGIGRGTGVLLSLLLGAWLYAASVATAHAQSCWIEGALGVDFGTVTPAGGEAAGSGLRYTCQGRPEQTLHYRACLFLDPGQGNTIAPRRMTNYNGSFMDYDLYSDPARTQIIGPAGSGHPVYNWTFTVPAGTNFSERVRLYGRVHPGQSLPAAWGFQEQGVNGSLRWRYSTGEAPLESNDCLTGGSGGGQVGTNSSGIHARFANACLIVAATDLDFGAVTTLPDHRDQTSTIQFQCPAGTPWRVGLDDGNHATGATRRMAGPGGRYLRYELYRDPQRTRRWGNTVDTDTSQGTGAEATRSLTVYGRVPAQPTPVPGNYSDTVTITLTY